MRGGGIVAALLALLFLYGCSLCSRSLVRPLRVGADLVCNEVVDTRFTRSRGTNGVGGGIVSAIYDNPTHQPVGAGAHDSPQSAINYPSVYKL